jgi:Domain of unknown function (DUF4440)
LLCQCARNDQKQAERYIIESERQWAESVATGDSSVVERILADDFLDVDPKGRLYDRGKMIAETRNAPQYFASNHLNEVKVRFTERQQLPKATNLGNDALASVDVLRGPIPGFGEMDAGKS